MSALPANPQDTVHQGTTPDTCEPKASDVSRPSSGLFVVFSGITPTIFESQVLQHAQDIRRANVALEIWVFALTSRSYDYSVQYQAELPSRFDVTLKVFRGVRPAFPLSEVFNAVLFIAHLRRLKPNIAFVHARGDYTAAVCGLAGLLGRFRVIWDCRGDTAAEFRLYYPLSTFWRRLVAAYKLCCIKLRLRLAARFCDKVIFVSKSLQKAVGGSLHTSSLEIVPSVASIELFHFSPKLRQHCRPRLHVADDRTVVVYSGSIERYQSFPQQIDWFGRLYAKDPSTCLLVVSPNHDQAETVLRKLPGGSWRLITVPMPEVNSYLCAADFGLFLREKNDVNYVASPVKFAEYSLAGLPILMTDAVEQSVDYARAIGNMVAIDLQGEIPALRPMDNLQRAEIAAKAARLLSREAAMAKYVRLYDE